MTMAPTETSLRTSSLHTLLQWSTSTSITTNSPHAPHQTQLATTILYNLQHQHLWTQLILHTHSPLTGAALPRPLISGVPPKRAYVHPDEQVEILQAEHAANVAARALDGHEGESTVEAVKFTQVAEREWVLPTHLGEKWSIKQFALVFDAVGPVPPGSAVETGDGEFLDEEEKSRRRVGEGWRGENRQKRMMLATLHDDSTVVYYIVHDGLVKPRQN